MKNGNVQEFVDHIHYGDELWFLYNDTKYFLEGWIENDILELVLYEMKENGQDYKWKGDGSLTVDSIFSLTKLLKTLIISMLLSFFIVKSVKINVVFCSNVWYNRRRR